MVKSFPGLSHRELLKLVGLIDGVEPGVTGALAAGHALLKAAPYGDISEYPEGVHELVFDAVQSVHFDQEMEGVMSSQLAAEAATRLHCLVVKHLPAAEVVEAMRSGLYHWLDDRVRELEGIIAEFEAVRVVARAAAPDAEINILRQGFILLMTAFDAAVFDLVRVALRRKFFALAGAFDKHDKVPLSKIADAGNFHEFREMMIEEQMKKRYIKDLLNMLNEPWKVPCVDPAGPHKFERLIEMVLRRNLHVHNRGVVDTRYVNDKNLDGLKLGEVAAIDEQYWDMANEACEHCVLQVATWANA